MTIDETKTAILQYVNNADQTKVIESIQVILNGLINNAADANNLGNILAALQAKIGTP